MLRLLKLEHLKYKRSSLFFILSSAICICYFVPILLLYTTMGSSVSSLIIFSEVLNFNGYLTLPILTILHFSFFLSYEYEKKTIYILKTSVFSQNKIFLSKFIYSIISFIGIFIPANVILIIFMYVSGANHSDYINTLPYSWGEIIGIFLLTHVMYLIYFITIGTMTFIISSIGVKQRNTLILSFSLFILLKILPIPKEVRGLTFLEGTTITTNLMDFSNVIYSNIQITLISLVYIMLFYYIGEYLFNKKNII